jgi:hypothetical protein
LAEGGGLAARAAAELNARFLFIRARSLYKERSGLGARLRFEKQGTGFSTIRARV